MTTTAVELSVVVEQRLGEAAKARVEGREVWFEIRTSGERRQYVAMYRVNEQTQATAHVIFAGDAGRAFEAHVAACRTRYQELAAGAWV